ncbi:cell division protein PerM [Saccharopolyspora taberi]|uniref:Integral membrane protein n=1 Tax=Saccharopolyspora taberi TaxID=60895 RepID=A0ABN3VJ70_9PSEU
MSVLDSIPHAIAAGESDRRPGFRWLWLAAAAVLVPLLGYLALAGLLALITSTAEDGGFSVGAVLLAALPGWLAAHQVPLSILGSPLSLLPLVPTLLVAGLTATAANQVARRSKLRKPTQARWVIAVLAGSHAALGTGVSLLLGDVVGAQPVDAFLCCGLTAALASAAGTANRCGLAYLVWERVGAEIWSGLRAGLLALAALIGTGALVALTAIGLSAPELIAALDRAGEPGDAFGQVVLSLLYLPNGIVAGWSFATGAGLSIGGYAAGPLHFTAGPVPEVPLLAALPSDGPAGWWPVALLLPPAVGVLTGVICLRLNVGPVRRLVVAGVAAGTAAIGAALLAVLSGGHLGNGPFDPVTLHPALVGALTLGWIAVPAGLVSWFTAPDVEEETTEEEPADPADEVPAEDDKTTDDEPPAEATPAEKDPAEAGEDLAADDEAPAEDPADAGPTEAGAKANPADPTEAETPEPPDDADVDETSR